MLKIHTKFLNGGLGIFEAFIFCNASFNYRYVSNTRIWRFDEIDTLSEIQGVIPQRGKIVKKELFSFS